MATFKDLKNDWSTLCQDCTDCWTHSDLQLAAELGKTLLERNKELENIIKLHQSTVEEQAQEIEYMKKQTAALREVNDSRLKIYEQLEVSIQDLERANHRLAIENSGDKKLIKSQCLTIENLESRCEELQKKIDELSTQRDFLLRQQHANKTCDPQTTTWKGSVTPGGSIHQSAAPNSPKSSQEDNVDANVRQLATALANDEEVTELLRQLQEARSQRAREQQKVAELGQQLSALLQENAALEEELNVCRNKAQDVKNLQDEISTLEEVRQGQLCCRCLRGLDIAAHDKLSVMLDQEEYDDISIAGSFVTDLPGDFETQSQTQDPNNKLDDLYVNPNPYRDLVEKYQALLDSQKHSHYYKTSMPCMSLQKELEMSGEFNSFHNPPSESESQQETTKSTTANGTRTKSEISGKKPFSATPTDFSETETSSSGFSDETSNKATQTEGRSGSFLCSIADGDDCKFSIYDDNNPFESRFRKTPEYRQIFSEIFSVLKRAAEAKDEGENLSLLDDSTSTNASQAESTANAQEDVPSEATDDNQSVMSSVVSSVVSEPVYRVQTPVPARENQQQKQQKQQQQSPQPQARAQSQPQAQSQEQNDKSEPTSTSSSSGNNNSNNNKNGKNNSSQPQNRSCLDYLSVNVHIRKKSSGKKNSNRRHQYNDRATTPDIIPTTNPKFVPPKSNSGGRRKYKSFVPTDIKNQQPPLKEQNPYTAYVCTDGLYCPAFTGHRNYTETYHKLNSAPKEFQTPIYEYKEYKPSTASKDVARLRRLEMSYAEVLCMSNKSKVNNRRS